jgi:hypothetical protein
MFMQRSWLAPSLGKGQQVEGEVAEYWKSVQSKGRLVAVGRRILSSDGPMVTVTTFAEDMAQLDQLRRGTLDDAGFQAHAAKVSPLLREPVKTFVLESIVAGTRRSGTTIGVSSVAFPAPGKERQIVSICEELVRSGQAAGLATSLWRRVYSSDGPMILVMARYADLAEFDKVRKERGQISREAAMAVSELSRAPIAQRIVETIVPLPPA